MTDEEKHEAWQWLFEQNLPLGGYEYIRVIDGVYHLGPIKEKVWNWFEEMRERYSPEGE